MQYTHSCGGRRVEDETDEALGFFVSIASTATLDEH